MGKCAYSENGWVREDIMADSLSFYLWFVKMAQTTVCACVHVYIFGRPAEKSKPHLKIRNKFNNRIHLCDEYDEKRRVFSYSSSFLVLEKTNITYIKYIRFIFSRFYSKMKAYFSPF